MTKAEYLKFHEEFCRQMMEITKRKNADYTGDSPSPFANFVKVETLGITDVETGFLVRLTDKFSRIISFAKKGELQVKDESVTDTIADACNYLILLAAYIKSDTSRA